MRILFYFSKYSKSSIIIINYIGFDFRKICPTKKINNIEILEDNVEAKLLLENNYVVGYVFDWFDNNTKIIKENDKIYAKVKSNEQALIYWCLQYGESVELIEPIETRKK